MTSPDAREVRAFLKAFFGHGNSFDPLSDPVLADQLRPWCQRVVDGQDRMLLPRLRDGIVVWYAMARTVRDARAFREELLAAVGRSYTDFTGIEAALDPDDPVDAAVLGFGDLRVFKLRVVDPSRDGECTSALQRMLTLHDRRPPNSVTEPRIPALVLRDFAFALDQRDRALADAALVELRAGGHLDARNQLFLEISLWEAFEEWDAIERELQQVAILALGRPRWITRALLRALYHRELAAFELARRPYDAIRHFTETLQHRFAVLLESRAGLVAAEVDKLFMIKAVATGDVRLRDAVLDNPKGEPEDTDWLECLAGKIAEPEPPESRPTLERGAPIDEAFDAYERGDLDHAFELLVEGAGGARRLGLLLRCALDIGTLEAAERALAVVEGMTSEAAREAGLDGRVEALHEALLERYTSPVGEVPRDWIDWAEMVGRGELDDNQAATLARQGAEEWSLGALVGRPGDVVALAEALQHITDEYAQKRRLALPHLQRFLLAHDPPDQALKPLLMALLEIYALDDARSTPLRRAATDVLEGLLRCGIDAAEYRDVIELAITFFDQVPADGLDWALDLLDVLVTLDAPEPAEIHRVVTLVQGVFERWYERLSGVQVALFRQLAGEAGAPIDFHWTSSAEADDEAPLAWLAGRSVALYSLNARAMARTQSILETLVEGVRVMTFDDRVGGRPALREAARTADVFLIATAAAKHAATAFIESHRAGDATTLRLHAKGSASMIRMLENPPATS